MNERVAVIGCGSWGKNLVRNFENLGCLAVVCDRDQTACRSAAKIAPNALVVHELERAFREDVTGVVIATPAETHFEIALAALLAGKDVFVEKPMARSEAEGAELAGEAERLRRILMV